MFPLIRKVSSELFTRRASAGFTLIELMMVVVMVGVLGVLATYSGRRYIGNAKSAEARNALGQMAKDATVAYEKDSINQGIVAPGTFSNKARNLCPSASASVPASITQVTARKYQSTAADWNADSATRAGFFCLKFSVDEPQYYVYSYTAQASGGSGPVNSFTASAQGDTDGNGVTSLLQVFGQLDSTNRLTISPQILEVRPDE